MSLETLKTEVESQLQRRHEGSNAYMAWWLVNEDIKAYEMYGSKERSRTKIKEVLEYWLKTSKIPVRKQQWKHAIEVLERKEEP